MKKKISIFIDYAHTPDALKKSLQTLKKNSFKLSILTLTNTVTSALYGMDNLSFFDLNNFTKVSLMIFMIFGKIEIIAVLFLIKKYIFKE